MRGEGVVPTCRMGGYPLNPVIDNPSVTASREIGGDTSPCSGEVYACSVRILVFLSIYLPGKYSARSSAVTWR